MPLRNAITLITLTIVCVACATQARRVEYGVKVGRAIQLVEDNFIEPIAPEELMRNALQGMIGKLDEFSEFIPPSNYQDFHSLIEQRFGGIGIQVEGPPQVPRLTVVAPIPRTPAFEAGIQPGDTILEIDGLSTEQLLLNDALKAMRGPIGSTVDLLIERMDTSQQIRVKLARGSIEVDSVVGDRIRKDSTWDYFLTEDPRIAYIRISIFGERTRDEFYRALDAIEGRAQALIIDLRYNPGGILDSAVDLCDALLDDGIIVSTKGRRTLFDRDFKAKPGLKLSRKIPIVVLINGDSASASEIMAGCLQDHGRAKIAGSRSYGKGTVQQVFEIESGRSSMKFTTARFLRPSGKNIHRTDKMTDQDEWGIQPETDLTMKLTELQEIYLNRRWYDRGDPRLSLRSEHPPEPLFAADPQLEMVAHYIQREWLGDNPDKQSESVDIRRPSNQATPSDTESPSLETSP